MVHVYPDMESLSHAAAELLLKTATEAFEARGRFVVALSGGSTPRRTYELLAQPPLVSRIDWSAVHVFWSDERCVPPEDSRSNERLARRALIDHVPIPLGQVHPFRCRLDSSKAALDYESLLVRFFGAEPPCFDLILLGLGRNAHTASLFPHTSALAETGRWTASVSLKEEGVDRVTFSPMLINRARSIVFLVAGADKAAVLAEVLDGPLEPDRLPAQLIRPEGVTHWLVDREAAGLLRAKGDSQ